MLEQVVWMDAWYLLGVWMLGSFGSCWMCRMRLNFKSIEDC